MEIILKLHRRHTHTTCFSTIQVHWYFIFLLGLFKKLPLTGMTYSALNIDKSLKIILLIENLFSANWRKIEGWKCPALRCDYQITKNLYITIFIN